MPRESGRRDELLAAATDFVLEHGLIGLSLRPLAAALGTSDRMLLYHFAGKDDLVAAVLHRSNDRSIAIIEALPAAGSVHAEVLALWAAATSAELARCQRLYVEAAALGLLGREPYRSVVREANRAWGGALGRRLVAAGMTPGRADRAVALLDAAVMGFQLDLPVQDRSVLEQVVRDLARAVVTIAEGSV